MSHRETEQVMSHRPTELMLSQSWSCHTAQHRAGDVRVTRHTDQHRAGDVTQTNRADDVTELVMSHRPTQSW